MKDSFVLASIIIPVWNGASVILDCLEALYQNTPEPIEVICVDNASADNGAALIAERYPTAIVARQPVNRGFAGGVNIGIDIASADLLVLLNQDCIVHAGWLTALLAAFAQYPEWGIAGATLLSADGSLEHTGAYIARPAVSGVHLTDGAETAPQVVDYVTGALFAIRRETWTTVGRFDEEFYPGYFEESDYCYRARHAGYLTGHVPDSRAQHLRSGQAWREDPLRHTSNQQRSRYRFAAKHLSVAELTDFFAYEQTTLVHEHYFAEATARCLAARSTLRALTEILDRRTQDLNIPPSAERYRLLQVSFGRLHQQALVAAQKLILGDLVAQSSALGQRYHTETARMTAMIGALEPQLSRLSFPENLSLEMTLPSLPAEMATHKEKLTELREHEQALLNRSYFQSQGDGSRKPLHSRIKHYLLWLFSFVSGRAYMLQSQLNEIQSKRMDALQQIFSLQQEHDNARYETVTQTQHSLHDHYLHNYYQPLMTLFQQSYDQNNIELKRLHQRLALLETLTDYDDR